MMMRRRRRRKKKKKKKGWLCLCLGMYAKLVQLSLARDSYFVKTFESHNRMFLSYAVYAVVSPSA